MVQKVYLCDLLLRVELWLYLLHRHSSLKIWKRGLTLWKIGESFLNLKIFYRKRPQRLYTTLAFVIKSNIKAYTNYTAFRLRSPNVNGIASHGLLIRDSRGLTRNNHEITYTDDPVFFSWCVNRQAECSRTWS